MTAGTELNARSELVGKGPSRKVSAMHDRTTQQARGKAVNHRNPTELDKCH